MKLERRKEEKLAGACLDKSNKQIGWLVDSLVRELIDILDKKEEKLTKVEVSNFIDDTCDYLMMAIYEDLGYAIAKNKVDIIQEVK